MTPYIHLCPQVARPAAEPWNTSFVNLKLRALPSVVSWWQYRPANGATMGRDEFGAYLAASAAVGPNGASVVRLRGAVSHRNGVSKPYMGIVGDYQRSHEVCNGRAVYYHAKMPTAMWWSNIDDHICWCVGPRKEIGTNKMWAYVPSMGYGPEEAGTRPWTVYSSEDASWNQQSDIEVFSLDGAQSVAIGSRPCSAAALSTSRRTLLAPLDRYAEKMLHERLSSRSHTPQVPLSRAEEGCRKPVAAESGGTLDDEMYAHMAAHVSIMYGAPKVRVSGAILHRDYKALPYVGINGDFQRSDQICNGRAVYMHVSSPTALWMSNNDRKICWCVGPTIMAGSDMMWGYVESKGFGPEEAGRRAWNIFSYISQSWETQTSVEVLNLNEAEVEVKDTVTPLAQMVENMVTAHVRSRPHSVQAAEANAEPVHVWPFGVGLNVVADDDGVYRVSGMNALSAAEVSGLIEVVYI